MTRRDVQPGCRVPDALVGGVRRNLKAIPGVSRVRIDWSDAHEPGMHVVEVAVSGWGPSLAARRVGMTVHLVATHLADMMTKGGIDHATARGLAQKAEPEDLSPSYERLLDALTDGEVRTMIDDQTSAFVGFQLILADIAAEHGLTAPIAETVDLGHLHMDEFLRDLLVETIGRRGIAELIDEATTNDAIRFDEAEWDDMAYDELAEYSDREPNGLRHDHESDLMRYVHLFIDEGACVVEITTALSLRQRGDAVDASFNGSTLVLQNTSIPATVIAGCPGRRVGDVVATGHAALDDRIIERVDVQEEDDADGEPFTRYRFEVESRPVPIG